MVRILAVVLMVMLSGVFSVMALENEGAAEIMLNKSGRRGWVAFPHHRHQDTLKDCQVCHTLFPREQGGIERLKKTGELVKKQVMNTHCIRCHKAAKKAGNKSGPTKCSKCHIKEKQ